MCAAIGLKSSPRTQYGQRITSLVSCAGMAGDGKRSPETIARRLPHLRVAQSRPGRVGRGASPGKWLVRVRGWHSRVSGTATRPGTITQRPASFVQPETKLLTLNRRFHQLRIVSEMSILRQLTKAQGYSAACCRGRALAPHRKEQYFSRLIRGAAENSTDLRDWEGTTRRIRRRR